ncbi:hypothetical protein [Planctomicrobium piriforme]|uniref:Uncharacterized protein n=1 Tax=Planctomicrobium piriforme TaxID=1576369 RepID=A0A1I3NI38_9PLAN|nr:hypothetical protein [Planctomicrobium piriforme]SFJ08847.1 hypothetical protein SAMN05421753_115105 [Planctomicrobium piriforme]
MMKMHVILARIAACAVFFAYTCFALLLGSVVETGGGFAGPAVQESWTYEHGFPFSFLSRTVWETRYDVKKPDGEIVEQVDGHRSWWDFCLPFKGEFNQFDARLLVADVAVAAVFGLLTAIAALKCGVSKMRSNGNPE